MDAGAGVDEAPKLKVGLAGVLALFVVVEVPVPDEKLNPDPKPELGAVDDVVLLPREPNPDDVD